MKLHIEPIKSLIDERMSINVSGMEPFGKVKITATMSLPWAKSVKFESHGLFTADSNGNVDLSKHKPDSGSYDFIDSMGLIISMKITEGKFNDVAQNISLEKSLFINIKAECGNDTVNIRVERLFKAPEIKKLEIRDHFVGDLFYSNKPSNITIIVLGGSDGNRDALDLISALLASHGYNVLSLGYFNEPGLPKKLAEVPLEYFEKVFKWLEKNPITKGAHLYVHGTSKGGELALLLASRYDFIKKVVALSPHGYCYQGLNFKNVSSWTYEGKPIPFIRIKNRVLFGNMLYCFMKNKPFGYAYSYITSLQAAKNKEDARIKVENSKADILMIAGKKDNIWNSWDGCVSVMEALVENNYKHKFYLSSYENAGHPFPLPYIIPAGSTLSIKMAPRFVFSTGGTVEGDALYQKDSWDNTLEFFKGNK